MKPTVPETGTVIKTAGDEATIMLKGGKSCKGCGAGKIGLCRAGSTSMMLIAKNDIGAKNGDTVMVGLDQRVQLTGYLLAYLIPLFSFIGGAISGYVAGNHLGIPSVDVSAGFAALAISSFYSFRKLRRLDNTSRMVVKRIVADGIFTTEVCTDEERRYANL